MELGSYMSELLKYLNQPLSSAQADELLAQGEDWYQVAARVWDENWWLGQSPRNANPLKHEWKISAFDATLYIQVQGYRILVDPGPSMPNFITAPDLILITHAHLDHTAKLIEILEKSPRTIALASSVTFDILCLLNDDIRYRKILEDHVLKLEYFIPKIICNFEVESFPAGHVLGACMFSLYHCGDRVLISGDFTVREVGGLPGCSLPRGNFGLFVMSSAGYAEKDSFPNISNNQNHDFLLQKVFRWLESSPDRLILSCKSLGEAQEAYAALVNAQRKGALTRYRIRMDGLVYKISELYYKYLNHHNPVWKFLPYQLVDIDDGDYIGLISQHGNTKRGIQDQKVFEVSEFVFTHASWLERLSLALSISCHSIGMYHGEHTSMKELLSKIGRKVFVLD